MSWRLINVVPGDIMNEWKYDEEPAKDLKMSIAECSHWLYDCFKKHKKRPSRYYLDYQKALHLI